MMPLLPAVILVFLSLSSTSAILQILPNETDFTVTLGGSLVLTCLLEHVDDVGIIVNIQWFFQDGLEILDKTSGRDGTAFVDKSIPLTSKLYINGVQAKHEGTYTCQAVLGGNMEKKEVHVILFRDITFDFADSPQHPTAFTRGLIQCRVSGQPNPSVFWRYRGVRLGLDSRYSQDAYGLYVDNITQADNGLYDCCAEVESTGQFKQATIDVIVNVPPQITNFPKEATGIASQELAYQCQATGLPQPKIEFYRGTDTNPLYTTARVQWDGDGGMLNFRPLIQDDDSDYTCRAYNSVGEDRAMGHLTVYIAPTVYLVRNVTANEGTSATLMCQSRGFPAPDMTYRKENALADYVMGNNDGGRIVLSSPEPGTLNMLVKDLTPDDMSNYTCRSRNLAGYHHLNGTITVNYAPVFPVGQPLSVYSWAGKTRNITCNVRAEPAPRFDWMHLNFQLIDNETYRIFQMFKASNLQVRIREYDQMSYGEYVCRARNQMGGANLSISLLRAFLPGKPSAAFPTEVTPTTIRLSISPPDNLGGSELLGYSVQHEIFAQEFYLTDPFLIEYLRASTGYVINVRARTEVGIGDPLSINVRTADVTVPYPIVITSNPIGPWPFQYTVTWQKPETGGLYIREYEFRMRAVKVKPGTHEVLQPLEDFSRRQRLDDYTSPMLYFMLEALNPATYYQLEIRALNDIGWSLPNSEFVFNTSVDTTGGLFSGAICSSEDLTYLSLLIAAVWCVFMSDVA